MPTVSRNEQNRSSDIIREVGVVPIRQKSGLKGKPYGFGTRESACEGKAPFTTKPAAEQSARRGTVAYRCRYCRFWHVGGASKVRAR